jgi:hypothetical protein
MKDFIGLNGHFKFKPALYAPVTRLVRNYHNIDWDVRTPGDATSFPNCLNGVNWDKHVYGKWRKHGFEIDASIQFSSLGPGNPKFEALWQGKDQWSFNYGYNLAQYFGPSGDHKLLTSVEIGNEPGKRFDDKLYKTIFISMANGIRQADPELKIVTCATTTGAADKYYKQLDQTFAGPEIRNLYDVISIHNYAFKQEDEKQHPWDRSYPEDPEIDFLKQVDEVIWWRNANVPGKEIWITEFGWDAVTEDKLEKRKGGFKKYGWQGVSDLQQAQYLIRAILCFSSRDVQRAYIYYFNDNNAPAAHAASGLTRKFEPKVSYWAVKHLYETLAEYKFASIVRREPGGIYVFEFVNGNDESEVIWVAWSPTGTGRAEKMLISDLPGMPSRIEKMPTKLQNAPAMEWEVAGSQSIRLTIDENPTYIFFTKSD